MDKVEDVLNVGDEVHVKIIDIDDRGKVCSTASTSRRRPRVPRVQARVLAIRAAAVTARRAARVGAAATAARAVGTSSRHRTHSERLHDEALGKPGASLVARSITLCRAAAQLSGKNPASCG